MYPQEHYLEKENTPTFESSFLDLDIKILLNKLTLNDKHDSFPFSIV